MKKRLFTMLLAVVMIIGLAPVLEMPSKAATNEALINPETVAANKPAAITCGGHTGVWRELGGGGWEISSGTWKYYLTGDVSSDAPLIISGVGTNVTICLCGHTWTYTGGNDNSNAVDDHMFIVKAGATLNIVDCSGKQNPGYIDGTTNSWVPCTEDGCAHTENHVNLTGGVLKSVGEHGGVVCIETTCNTQQGSLTFGEYRYATVNFMGGNIAGSTSTNIVGNGLIAVFGGTFNMVGGTITGNTTGVSVIDTVGNRNAYYGNGTCYGQFNMYGGKVQYNTVRNGAILYIRKSNNDNGAATLVGGEISNNDTRYITNNGEVLLETCGTIYLQEGVLQLWGNPQIINNKGAGIFLRGHMHVSGSPVVTGNKLDENTNSNVVVMSRSHAIIVGAYPSKSNSSVADSPVGSLSSDAKLGVYLWDPLTRSENYGLRTVLSGSNDASVIIPDELIGGVPRYDKAATTRSVQFKVPLPSLPVTAEDTSIQYSNFTDTASYTFSYLNYNEAELAAMQADMDTVMAKFVGDEDGWIPAIELTPVIYSSFSDKLLAKLEKIGDTDYRVTYKLDEAYKYENAQKPFQGIVNVSIYHESNDRYVGADLTIEQLVFNAPTEEVFITTGVGSTVTWTPSTVLPYGVTIYSDGCVNVPEALKDYIEVEEIDGSGNDEWDLYHLGSAKITVKQKLEEATHGLYFELPVEYCVDFLDTENASGIYVPVDGDIIGMGTLKVNIMYPGINGSVDTATRLHSDDPADPADYDYDAVYGKVNNEVAEQTPEFAENTSYIIRYIDVDDTDRKIVWVDNLDGDNPTETVPTGLAVNLPVAVDGQAILTVSNTAAANAGTYYFRVVADGMESNVMSYTIKKDVFGDDVGENDLTEIELITTMDTAGKQVTIDLSTTSGGVFGTPAEAEGEEGEEADNDWFSISYTGQTTGSLTVTVTIDGANAEIPVGQGDGKIEVAVTGCPNYEDYVYTFIVKPIYKSINISNPASVTYGTPSTTEGSVQYIVLDGTTATFDWVTDVTGNTIGTAPTGIIGGFASGDATKQTLTFTYDGSKAEGSTNAGTYYFKVTVDDGVAPYSAVGSLTVDKASVPSEIVKNLECDLLFLVNSSVSVDLAEKGAIVPGGDASTFYYLMGGDSGFWVDSNVTKSLGGNVFTITNKVEIPEGTASKLYAIKVTSTNYVDYRVDVTVNPLFKEVNVGEQGVDRPVYGIPDSSHFVLSNVELKDAKAHLFWLDENGNTINAPAGVTSVVGNNVINDQIHFVLEDADRRLTILTSANTPAGTYRFIVVATDESTNPIGTYTSAVTTFTVDKATYVAPDQTATFHYTDGSGKDFTDVVPNNIAENKSHVDTDVSDDDFSEVYNPENGKITVSREGNLSMTEANLADKVLYVSVSGGASGNYNDYYIKFTITPDFKVLDSDLPEITVPNGTTNILKINNKTQGVSFRIRETTTGFDTGWTREDGLFTLEPLAAGDYIVEACYTNMLSVGDEAFEAHKDKIITPVGTYEVKDPAQTVDTIDLYPSDGRFSPSMNEYYQYYLDRTYIPEAEYVYHENQWKKLTTPGKANVITSANAANGISSYNLPYYGDLELTLKNVNTTGDLAIMNLGDFILIIEGDVTTGDIACYYDLDISGKGGADSLTAIDLYSEGASVTVNNVAAFKVNDLRAYDGDITVDKVGTITTASITADNVAIKNFNTLDITGTITTDVNVTIDGNGDAVLNGEGKDTNTTASAEVNLVGGIEADGTVTIDGVKEMLVVCDTGVAIIGADGVILNNIKEFGINKEYNPNVTPVMDVCDIGIATNSDADITFTDVNKVTIFTGEMGLVAKNVTMENVYGEITTVNTSGDEKSVTASGEFLVINRSAVVKSGENKRKAATLKLSNKVIDGKNVKAVVASGDVGAYFSITRPINYDPTIDVPVSNDKNKVNAQATVSGLDADIRPLDKTVIEQILSDENAAGNVVIDLTGLGQTIDTAGIPKQSLKAIVEAAEDIGNDTEHLVIKLTTATLTIDDIAMRAILNQADGDIIKFNFDDVGLSRMNGIQKYAVRDMDVRKGFEAYITVNDVRVSDFNGGNVEITVPYAVPAGENIAGFSVWYIDEDGNPEKLKSTYDGKEKCFVVTHFSDYVIVYDADDINSSDCPKDETCPIHPYTDTIKTEWYHDGVHYCIENGLMIGISDNVFAPGMITNRAMIATILWRMEGMPSVDYDMTFEDVAEGLWYTEAIRWAQSVGVVEGYNAQSFGPTDSITREQMATILWRYCKYKGIDVSVGEDTNILSYEDALDVSTWAMPAMQWACGSGMIEGLALEGGMYLDPQGDAIRCQSATMIYRFCTQIIK